MEIQQLGGARELDRDAVSNTYYPDTRTVSDNVGKLMLQLGTDSVSNVLKEFWPDIKRKFFQRNKRVSAPDATAD